VAKGPNPAGVIGKLFLALAARDGFDAKLLAATGRVLESYRFEDEAVELLRCHVSAPPPRAPSGVIHGPYDASFWNIAV